VNRDVQGVLLVLLGGAVLRISLTDVHLRYVKPEFAPLLIVGGAVLLALGLVAVLFDRAPGPSGDGAGEHEDEQEHGHPPGAGPRVAWLLLLPVLAIFLVAPPALGSYAAARDSGIVADPGTSDFPPLPGGDPVETTVLDYATRAVWDEGLSLAGRTVRITGFVSPAADGGWFLTRIALSCCAGDGRAFKIKVVEGPGTPPRDAWVEVTGEYVPTDVPPGDDVIPSIRALEVVTVPPPRNPYDPG